MGASWGEYEGKKAVIVGCATGMGAATAELLVKAGAEVYAYDVKPVDIAGVKHSGVCNLLDQGSIDEAVESMGGNIDAVFSCAGLPTGFSWADTLTVNFYGPRYMINKLLPKMNKGGAVATIASLTLGWERQFGVLSEALACETIEDGRQWAEKEEKADEPRWPEPYSFSKQLLAAWTTLEAPRFLEEYGVRLNTLGPGVTTSPMFDTFIQNSGDNIKSMPNPIGRWSEPGEQAQAMMFLNSPLATYLAGAILPNDAGLTAALLGGGLKSGGA